MEKKLSLSDNGFLLQLIAGILAYLALHESLHWLPGRLFSWKPEFGVDKFLGIPAMFVVRYKNPPSGLTISNHFRIFTASYTPLVLIPMGYAIAGFGFIAFGVPFIALSLLNLPFETKQTIANIRELRMRKKQPPISHR
jgi:hypothetical protein